MDKKIIVGLISLLGVIIVACYCYYQIESFNPKFYQVTTTREDTKRYPIAQQYIVDGNLNTYGGINPESGIPYVTQLGMPGGTQIDESGSQKDDNYVPIIMRKWGLSNDGPVRDFPNMPKLYLIPRTIPGQTYDKKCHEHMGKLGGYANMFTDIRLFKNMSGMPVST